jgi:hypothetical protein
MAQIQGLLDDKAVRIQQLLILDNTFLGSKHKPLLGVALLLR